MLHRAKIFVLKSNAILYVHAVILIDTDFETARRELCVINSTKFHYKTHTCHALFELFRLYVNVNIIVAKIYNTEHYIVRYILPSTNE